MSARNPEPLKSIMATSTANLADCSSLEAPGMRRGFRLELPLSPASWASFLAGALTPFTLSIGGEMPVGEIVLMLVAGWAMLCLVFNHAWPGPLLQDKLTRSLLAAQFVALCGYVFSDLYRGSSSNDIARGWSRMIFLAIDIVAMAYLFGRSPGNLLVFLFGRCLGEAASAMILGPLFGDLWKFGFGTPLTILLFWIAPIAGPVAAVVAAAAAGVLHFSLDYRSLGSLCMVAGTLTVLQVLPKRSRLWLAPLGAVVVGGAIVWTYGNTRVGNEGRGTRSDVERSAMATAAVEAFEESPLIGHGSWFSNSNVYDNFALIRHDAARAAHVGGFPDRNEGSAGTAIHSQILVALAEGGLFGGAFFFVYGASLAWTLYLTVFVDEWNRLTPLCTLLLLFALWNLFFSPFSGAHRVHIAMTCALMLLLRTKPLNLVPGETEP